MYARPLRRLALAVAIAALALFPQRTAAWGEGCYAASNYASYWCSHMHGAGVDSFDCWEPGSGDVAYYSVQCDDEEVSVHQGDCQWLWWFMEWNCY